MIPPPSGQDSCGVVRRRSPSPYTAVSSKPTTSTRKRISARASFARSVGQTWGGGVLSVMTPSLVPPARPRLGRFRTPRRATRSARSPVNAREVADQVRLVGVAAASAATTASRHAAADQRARARSKRITRAAAFGVRPDLGAEPRGQVALAPADRRGPRRRSAPSRAEARSRRQARHTSGAAAAVRVQHRRPSPRRAAGSASGPGPRPRAAARQLVAEPAEQVRGGEVEGGQLAGRQPEQRAGAQRAELQLDAGLRAVVLDDARAWCAGRRPARR